MPKPLSLAAAGIVLALCAAVYTVAAEDDPPPRIGANGAPVLPDPTRPRAVTAPKIVADDLKPDAPKQQVLIYYANETRGEGQKMLAGWLVESKDARLKQIGTRLTDDEKTFAATVKTEVEALGAVAAKGDKPFALVVFTNALAAEGKFLYLTPAGTKFETGTIKLPKFVSPVLAAQPLSSPHTFAAALLAANKQFPADKHSYLLVSKSHGTTSMVVTPLVQNPMRAADKERVLAGLAFDLDLRDYMRKQQMTLDALKRQFPTLGTNKDETPTLTGTNKDETPTLSNDKVATPVLKGTEKDTVPTLGKENGLGGYHGENLHLSADTIFTDVGGDPSKANGPLDAVTLAALDFSGPEFLREAALVGRYVAPPPVRDHVGIAKPIFLSILREAGAKHGMSFPVVFLESCKSDLSPALVDWLKEQPNVGRLYASDINGLDYTSLNYPKLFAEKGTAGARLDAALRAKYEADQRAFAEKNKPKK